MIFFFIIDDNNDVLKLCLCWQILLFCNYWAHYLLSVASCSFLPHLTTGCWYPYCRVSPPICVSYHVSHITWLHSIQICNSVFIGHLLLSNLIRRFRFLSDMNLYQEFAPCSLLKTTTKGCEDNDEELDQTSKSRNTLGENKH